MLIKWTNSFNYINKFSSLENYLSCWKKRVKKKETRFIWFYSEKEPRLFVYIYIQCFFLVCMHIAQRGCTYSFSFREEVECVYWKSQKNESRRKELEIVLNYHPLHIPDFSQVLVYFFLDSLKHLNCTSVQSLQLQMQYTTKFREQEKGLDTRLYTYTSDLNSQNKDLELL